MGRRTPDYICAVYSRNLARRACNAEKSRIKIRSLPLIGSVCCSLLLQSRHRFLGERKWKGEKGIPGLYGKMFSKGKYMDGGDGREMGAKRQRLMGPNSAFYGGPMSSNFMYNTSAFSFMAQPPPFPVVRLRGLPFDCMESDVADFFHGLEIVDVLFVHKSGRFSGEAFCVLGYPLHVDFALHRNRQNMGRRYIEVFRSNRQEYYHAVSKEVSDVQFSSPKRGANRARSYDDGKDGAIHTGVLRLRGLPFSVGKDDILDFFKDFEISEDCVHIVVNSEGRASGEGFVEFANAEQSKAAMAKDRMTLGSRYIELFPSSVEELDDAVSRGR